MTKTYLLDALLSQTDITLGYSPSTPTEFNQASLSISKIPGLAVSASTLRRLYGYVAYDGEPSVTTLNTLARFNGYKSWEDFCLQQSAKQVDDSDFLENEIANTERLVPGDRLTLGWHNGKGCILECISYQRFRVVSSTNIQLQPESTCKLTTVCMGHPLYVTDVHQGNEIMAAYVGAKKGGITSIAVTPAATSDAQ